MVYDMVDSWLRCGFFCRTNYTGGMPLPLEHILNIHTFAVRFEMYNLQNDALTLLFQKLAQNNTWKIVDFANWIYDQTESKPGRGDNLRKFLVGTMTALWDFDMSRRQQYPLKAEILIGILTICKSNKSHPGYAREGSAPST